MADTSLNDLFEESVQVSVEDITCDLHPGEVDPPNEPCKVILGKLFCHTRLGRKAIQGSLNNAWASISGWSWKEREDGLLQFSFRTSFDAENVLLRRPWLVCGYLLVLMPWPSWLTPEEVKFDHTPIWVRLKSIPPFYWNKTNLQEMAGKVSKVYELPRHIEKNFERGSFGMGTLRFRATVELSKPLFSGFFLWRTGIKDLWLQYQYEKLPRICYKCGLMTHEHKFCFKTPAVIKNTKGEFFPMFGNWMAKDAIERSPFTLPLPKWFSEWIVNQKAAKDEKMRQLLKNQRLSLQIECADSRELRTQYPGKRRQVETVVETRVSSGELVINRYPAVTLPGIGEVTPFENTANLIVEKILPDLPPLEVIRTMQKKKDVPSCSGTKIVSAKTGTRHAIPHSPSDHQDAESLGDATEEETIIEAPNLIAVGTQAAKDENDKLEGAKGEIAQVEQNNTMKSPRKLGSGLGLGLDPKSPFGTQAHIMEYPSKECWDLAFNQLLGAQTVDKFHREPTLFNPILDIEEIRCYEANQGPRKRKATNGFYMLPKKDDESRFQQEDEQRVSPRNEETMDSPLPCSHSGFSPGSMEKDNSRRRRGRPRKNSAFVPKPTEPTRKRGRPTKEAMLAMKPKSFKKESDNKRKNKVSKHYCNSWDTASVELAIDLNNHFVFMDGSYVPPDGLAGGFGVVWRNGMKGTVMSEDKNLINVLIESEPPGTPWNLLGVYGPPSIMGREVFWNRIGDLILNNTNPTVIIGDLNGTLADNENLHYSNWRNPARYSFDLRRMVARTGMIDLGSQGGKFTWFQKLKATSGGCGLKRARLDRALASIEWRLLYPNAITHVLSAATSDHRPILLDMNGGTNCNRTYFKYELMWGRDPKCYWVVKNAWKEKLHQHPMINFYRKLKNTKDQLARWNRIQFKLIGNQMGGGRKTLPT
ncbi:hypothetical protein G4B88_001242 [Cannabis sativa]|uniref:DUF4283 domain-containing protein n=1 Tax=Cannabis sativa TaxID=3483 RepID=A0A7J6HZE8_CANSA|nr:hypothetical protein G4B88_001242 [Cannabis sativa]